MAHNIIARKWLSYTLLCGSLFVCLTSLADAQSNDRSRQLTQPESPQAQKSLRRGIALVIGNGNYRNAPGLANPVNDARDMTLVLRILGFEVVEKEDQTVDQMKLLIKEFGARLSQSKLAGLFYYAGHGIQVRGKNYLIPVEARNLRENFIEFDAVDVDRVLREMEDAANGVNIVILDACRSNPFTRSWRSAESGLAQISTPKGTLIAYATAPGSVADDGERGNGLYTSELMHWMKQPGLNVEEMFKQVRSAVVNRSGGKQVPAESTMLIGDFYFSGTDKRTSNDAQSKNTGPALGTSDIELLFWETIKDSSNPDDFKAYLNAYPNGRFTELAKIRAQHPREKDNVPGIGDFQQPVRKGNSKPINKAGKVVLSWAAWAGSHSQKEMDEIFASLYTQFLPSLSASLKAAGLNVTEYSAVEAQDYRQISGATLQIVNGQKASARSVPFSVSIEATVGIEDLPQYSGMYISVATVRLRAFDLEQGEIVAEETITDVKGFGNDQAQARRNALREAGQKIPATFISKVADKSR